jgi:CPA1 family monovalent cation:H+ antiporter
MTYTTVVRWKIRRYGLHQPRPMLRPSLRGGLIISWCGMRGIVTLAAALALPASFPQRDLIVLTAFAVVVGTLLLQGLTLRPLLFALDLHDDNPVEREVRLARIHGLRTAIASFAADKSPAAEALRAEYEAALERMRHPNEPALPAPELPSDALRRHALAAAREEIEKLRGRGDIGDDAYHVVQEELDRQELSVEGN